MSKLEELIEELCPDGVEYLSLLELADIGTGSSNTNEELIDGKYPFFVRSQEVRTKNEYEFDEEAIITSGDGVGVGKIFHYVNGKYALHQRAYRIHFRDNRIIPRFFLHYMKATFFQYISKSAVNSSVTSVRRPMMNKYPVPVPPLQVQREIIRILDNFTEYIEMLSTELELRKRQSKYYEYELLKFDDNVDYVKIGDCCNVEKGKTPIQKVVPGEYPLVATTEHRQSSSSYQFDCSAVCVPLISSRGHGVASISRIYYQEGKFALGNILCAIIPNNNKILSAEFLRYYLFAKKDTLLVPLMRGGANVALTTDSLKGVKIPIPPIEFQLNLIERLKRFDELENNKLIGIPAEIEARSKQYEYYRDKLLTFKELS
ncbi:MAG: restriction endonuclease subunit S [Sedimentibacter saalensis]|uniref:restriction endonuclease subunit S n=1 Tax=Sedimentibacter saalensis TaxID=130788 RepID=UPI003158160E